MLKAWQYLLCIVIATSTLAYESGPNINDTQPVPVYGFEVDYETNQFLLDGKPFRYISGSFHYFRTPRAYWRDRLRKMRIAGLNAVSTYVEWSLHQPTPDTWHWTGEADLVAFIKMAQDEDLFVLLRPGPYICAERDLGGLPSWLMSLVPDIKMRTNDRRYMAYVEVYLEEVLRKLQHLFRGNGGPIIMVQVENEYGSFHACDEQYKQNLFDIMYRIVQDKALLYTTDGANEDMLKCGVVSGAYSTVDFGASSNPEQSFSVMRKYQPSGPFVNSEYYSGWLTHWDEPLQTVDTQKFIETFRKILHLNASVNIYMFYGGTNFGFTAGANNFQKYWPQITSYDYDAPLTEAGDPTDKYFAIRDTIAEFLPLPNLPVPMVSPKGNYGSVLLEPVLKLMNNTAKFMFSTIHGRFNFLPTFEKLNFTNGLVLYESIIPVGTTDPFVIHGDVADRGLVYVDNYLVGTFSRTLQINDIVVQNPYPKKLSILVENQGHLNFGNLIEDWKGLLNIQINEKNITDWDITGFSLNEMKSLKSLASIYFDPGNLINGPVFLRGTFTIKNDPMDTYLSTSGWGKGIAYINGHNLGRYWPQTGPQVTLYVPSVFLKTGENELVIFEMEYVPENMKMKFQIVPDFSESSPNVYYDVID